MSCEESCQETTDSCEISVETCAKVEKFFKAFHELFAMATEVEV